MVAIPFWAYILIFAVVAYLIGSIPTGYLIVKAKTGQDIRTIGSGSTGATNVKRVLGKKWFFTVMVLDAIKGMVPVLIAKYLTFGDSLGLVAVVSAVMVIIGHSKPLFLGFKGGKSVASGIGTIYALNFYVGLILTVVWSIITYFTKYVSVGSIIALICAPFLMYFLKNPIGYTVYATIAAIYIVYLHRENIKRLLKGTENKVRN
ncbi:TPA: glycerol-3-phosphate 1-O-acyltransferase PlsY [Candidatus Galligastranaerophilus intestinigallinarum]|nr:glycerol-3-phosphate 1-O-acyltransferase PlsY [Candidatus Galligastranaerophilus intestinigallinarum]